MSTSALITPIVAPMGDFSGGAPGGADGTAPGTIPASPASPAAAGPLAAAYTPTYDPNSPTPYVAPNLPQTVQPIPNQLPDQREPSQQELGAARGAGTAAYLGNQIMRGYMQGKAVRDLRNAVQVHQQSTGLQSIYNDAAQQLQTMAQTGVPPDSPEFQKAQQHVQASWQSLMDFYGQHVEKPGKGKNGQQSTMQKIQEAFQSQDPAKVSSAVYEGLQVTGPPVLHQIAPYLTPAYQAKVQQRAATAGATAEVAQSTAQNQVELQRLLSLPSDQQTPETQDRIMQLKYGISKGTALPPNMTWKVMPAAQAFKGDDGQWYRPQINGIGGSRMAPLGPDYQPSAAELKEAPGHTFKDKDDVWYTYSLGRDGNPDPTTVKPLSAAVAAGPVNRSSDAQRLVQVGDQWITKDVHSSSTTTRGTPGAAGTPAPLPPGAAAQTPIAIPAAAAPAGTTQPATAAPSATAPTPAQSAAPPPPAPPPASAARPVATGAAPPVTRPPNLNAAFQTLPGLAPKNSAVGMKETPQEGSAYRMIQDSFGNIDKSLAMLAPIKNEGGLLDALKQQGKYSIYRHGISMGPLSDALNQMTALQQITGGAAWTKAGRNVTVFNKALEHLPDPSTDSPGLMYDKISTLKNIYVDQLADRYARMQQAMPAGTSLQVPTIVWNRLQQRQAAANPQPPAAQPLAGYKYSQTNHTTGQRVGSNDGIHWIDSKTGKAVK